jgi:hypothetical protein
VRAYPEGVIEPVEFDHFAHTGLACGNLLGPVRRSITSCERLQFRILILRELLVGNRKVGEIPYGQISDHWR